MSRWILPVLLLTALPVVNLRADENAFAYSYSTEVLPRGRWEVEQWMTSRIGKESGTFVGTDLRTEIETGITDRLQGALYLNYNHTYSRQAQGSSGPIDDRNRFGVSGTSMEFKYQVFSPIQDRIGLALYLEPGYGTIEAADGAQIGRAHV